MKTKAKWQKVLLHVTRWILFLPASVLTERIAGAIFFMLTRDLYVSWFGSDFSQGMTFVDASFEHPIAYGWIGCLQSIFFVLVGATIVPNGKRTVATIQGVLRIGFFVWLLLQTTQHSGSVPSVFILAFWMIAGSAIGIIMTFRIKGGANNGVHSISESCTNVSSRNE